jgi:hypothetical protein
VGHVWTAPAVQEESDVSAKGSGAVMYLSSANRLLASIRFMLIVLTLVVIVIGLKVAHYW